MKCDYCGYEWISVSPVETRELECPRCGKMSSVEADPPDIEQRLAELEPEEETK